MHGREHLLEGVSLDVQQRAGPKNLDADSQLTCFVVPPSCPFMSTATMRTARGSAWKTTLVFMAGRWLVAVVGAVEMCDNKAPVVEVFQAFLSFSRQCQYLSW